MFKNTCFEEYLQTRKVLKGYSLYSDPHNTVNSKLNMRFSINHFLHHRSTTTMHYQVRFKLCRHQLFISALVALDRRFNAASKKKNTDGIYIHIFYIQMPINFLIKSFLKTTSSSLTHIILMNRIRLLIETVAQRCSVKRAFLEILQNSQENTCARVSFLIKLQP